MAEQSEAKSAKRSFVSKNLKFLFFSLRSILFSRLKSIFKQLSAQFSVSIKQIYHKTPPSSKNRLLHFATTTTNSANEPRISQSYSRIVKFGRKWFFFEQHGRNKFDFESENDASAPDNGTRSDMFKKTTDWRLKEQQSNEERRSHDCSAYGRRNASFSANRGFFTLQNFCEIFLKKQFKHINK